VTYNKNFNMLLNLKEIRKPINSTNVSSMQFTKV